MSNYPKIETFWTDLEKSTLIFRKAQCENVRVYKLRDCLEKRMHESSMGSFLYHLNSCQLQENEVQQDKLDRLQHDVCLGLVDRGVLERRDDICPDLLQQIQQLLQHNVSGTISKQDTLQQLTSLRLAGSNIKEMDSTLKNLENLKALVLSGNCISSVQGKWLPRNLQLLELCSNRVQDLSLLMRELPPLLVYLGLGRNCLTQDDLQPLVGAKYLHHLDLSHNNIAELSSVTNIASSLHNLSSLMLYGNPCSMTASYKDFISVNLPSLIFLDGKILKNNKPQELNTEAFDLTGSLQITVFRIMGLTQPPKKKINNKKTLHSYRLEIDCPVLKNVVPERKNSFVELQNQFTNKQESSQQSSTTKNTNFDVGKTNKSKKPEKKAKEKSIKQKRNIGGKENDKAAAPSKKVKDPKEETEEEIAYKNTLTDDKYNSNLCLKSARKNWAKIVEFSEPTIEVADCSLFGLRDVFRSVLTVRIVHLETLPPPGKKKTKPKSRKIIDSKTLSVNEDSTEDQDLNKEILVSRTTEAKFKVHLGDIFWNQDTLDFSWHKSKPLIVSCSNGLKNLEYVLKMKKTAKLKKEETSNLTELAMPRDLTCHVGIGLKRTKTNL